jgi:hypothetical protein
VASVERKLQQLRRENSMKMDKLILLVRSFGQLGMLVGLWEIWRNILGGAPLSFGEALIFAIIGIVAYIGAAVWEDSHNRRQDITDCNSADNT